MADFLVTGPTNVCTPQVQKGAWSQKTEMVFCLLLMVVILAGKNLVTDQTEQPRFWLPQMGDLFQGFTTTEASEATCDKSKVQRNCRDCQKTLICISGCAFSFSSTVVHRPVYWPTFMHHAVFLLYLLYYTFVQDSEWVGFSHVLFRQLAACSM